MKQIKELFSKYSLIIVVAAVIIAVIVWTALVPVSDSRKLREEIRVLEKRHDALKAKAAGEDGEKLTRDLAEAEAALKEYEKIFPPEKIRQTDTYPVIQLLEQSSGLKVSSMSYEQTHFDNLNQALPAPPKGSSSSSSTSTVPSNAPQPPMPGKGMKMTAATNFTATYDQLKHFVTLLNAQEQSIGLREFQIATNKTQLITGSFILEFYGFMPEE